MPPIARRRLCASTVSSLLRKFFAEFARPPRRRPRWRPFIEPLEDRFLLSSIFGSIWSDLDGDALRDSNEPALAAATVFLDRNSNGQLDSAVQNFASAANPSLVPGPFSAGDFAAPLEISGVPLSFSDLNVSLQVSSNVNGSVLVGLLSPFGRTVGAGPTLFFLNKGDQFNGGFDDEDPDPVTRAATPYTGAFRPQERLGLPHGHVYGNDPNGVWNLLFFLPPGANPADIQVTSWSLHFTVPGEVNTQTGPDGAFEFSGLDAGTYNVAVQLPPGAAQTFPAGPQVVQLGANQTVSGVNFGVRPVPDLAGTTLRIEESAPDWGDDITVNYTLTNRGEGNAGPFDVEFRLSPDGMIGSSDVLLHTLALTGLAALTSTSGALKLRLPGSPGNPPAGFAGLRVADVLLGLRVDVANTVAESDETNNSNEGAGADMAFLATAPNQALANDGGVQQMPSIAVNPLDPNHLVTVYMDYALVSTGYAGLGTAVSHDGGATWQRSTVPLPAGFDQGAAYPTVRFDAQGRPHVVFMAATFPGTKPTLTYPFDPVTGGGERALGLKANNGIFLSRSDDGGLTWNVPGAVVANVYSGVDVFYDTSPDLGIDTFALLPSGQPNPNLGNLYVVWTRHYPPNRFPGFATSAGGGEIMLAVSTDGGQSWTNRLRPDGIPVLRDPASVGQTQTPGNSLNLDPKITVGPEGDLYVSQFAGAVFPVYYSSNAGVNFLMPDRTIRNLGLPFGQGNTSRPSVTRRLKNNNFRVFPVRQIVADPKNPGYVYALESIRVVNQFTGAEFDAGEINFARSTDYGRTWERIFSVGSNPSNLPEVAAGFRQEFRSVLNDENDGRYLRFNETLADEVIAGQALPKLAVDEDGNLAMIWYDTRRDPNDHNLDVFATVSTDGGKTFTANFRISDASFDADAGKFTDAAGKDNYYLGDLIGLAAAGGYAFAVWTDTRLGNQDVFFSRFSITPAPAPLQDRFEYNDAPAAATPLGVLALPKVLPRLAMDATDEDWFSVTSAATGTLSVSVSAAQGGATLRVEIWDAAGQTLLATGVNLFNAAGELIGAQVDLAAGTGQSFLIRVTGSSNGVGPVAYSLAAQSLTADLGTVIHAQTSGGLAAGERAIYQVRAGVTGALDIDLAGDPSATGANLIEIEVRGSDGATVLAHTVAEPGTLGRLSIPVDQGQVVFIHVFANSPRNFTLELTNRDQYAFLNGPKVFNDVRRGTIDVGVQSVVIPFTATATGLVQATVHVANGWKRTAMRLDFIRANGAVISSPVIRSTTTPQGLRVSLSLSVEAGEQISIRVLSTPTTTAAQDYLLEFSLTSSFPLTGDASLFFPAGGFPANVESADLNRDGHADLVVTSTRLSDAISVLLGNGDGTFQAPRQFAVGAGLDAQIHRDVVVRDFSGDGILDIAVANPLSADVSLLLGRGDGSFEPHRRFDTTFHAASLASGDFNGDNVLDLVSAQNLLGASNVSILLGRGDGTFRPGGVFASGGVAVAGQVADLNGDGKADILTGDLNNPIAYFLLGNGDGTFQKLQSVPVGLDPTKRGVFSIVAADLGSQTTRPDGTTSFGPADGIPDLVVNIAPRAGVAQAQLIVVPGLLEDGAFAGFGTPRLLAEGDLARPMTAADLNGDQAIDVAAADIGGVRVVYTEPPAIAPNTTLATARDLGTVVHSILPTQALVPGQADAYFTLTVPTEAVAGAGDAVLDFSALFEHATGAGLSLEVFDAAGNLLGSGSRFRVRAPQGEQLTLHVFGVDDGGGNRGSGAFTLVVDVLPQLVKVEAGSILPGGAATTLTLTFQGDRLDPATAEDPANYTIVWLGPDGQGGTADDVRQRLAQVARPVVYNPGANVVISSGRTYPTAVRQTVTLLFDEPLPAGAYRIEVAPAVQAADVNEHEAGLLVPRQGLSGHPVASLLGDGVGLAAIVEEGAVVEIRNLVAPAGQADLDRLPDGTPFLTQLQNDLGAILDRLLVQAGDDPSITPELTQQILARFAPALTGGQTPTSFLIVWLDPVDIDLADAQGTRTVFNMQSNTVTNSLPRTYIEVGGNVELVVMAGVSGRFTLNVDNVPQTARGGAVVIGGGRVETTALTTAMRAGEREFQFLVPATVAIVPPGTIGGGGDVLGNLVLAAITASTASSSNPAAGGPATTVSADFSAVGGEAIASLLVGLAANSLYGIGDEETAFAGIGALVGQVTVALVGYAAQQLTVAAAEFSELVAQAARTGVEWLQAPLAVAEAAPVVPWASVIVVSGALGAMSPMLPAGAALMAAGVLQLRAANGAAPAGAPAQAAPAAPAAAPTPAPAPRTEQNEESEATSEAAVADPAERKAVLAPAAPMPVSALAATALFAAGFLWHGPTPAQRPRSRKRQVVRPADRP
jgi:hypothetical protein